ncbi:MAG: hypothetical protein FWD29_07930 [Micrococcales bacterium]|nr:hypothetical protein [Micrococcales bacterium]
MTIGKATLVGVTALCLTLSLASCGGKNPSPQRQAEQVAAALQMLAGDPVALVSSTASAEARDQVAQLFVPGSKVSPDVGSWAPDGPDKGTMVVRVEPPDQDPQTIVVIVVYEDSEWKIYDIVEDEPPTESSKEAFAAVVAAEELLAGQTFQAQFIKHEEDGYLFPRIEWPSLSGAINFEIADFDGDGEDELLVIRLEPRRDTDQRIGDVDLEPRESAMNSVYAHLYEYTNGAVTDVASAFLASEALAGDSVQIDVFAIRNPDDGLDVCAEHDRFAYLFSDGHFWTVTCHRYGADGFRQVVDTSYGGSDLMESDLVASQEALAEVGITMPTQSLVVERIVDLHEGAKLIAGMNANPGDIPYELVEEFRNSWSATLPPIMIRFS